MSVFKKLAKIADFSRRGFFRVLAAAGMSAAMPKAMAGVLEEAASAEGDSPATSPAEDEEIPEMFQHVAANPNYKSIRNFNRAPPVWVEEDKLLAWVQMNEKTGEPHLWSWEPLTPMDLDNARELHDVYYWRSWRTLEELEELVADEDEGPWVIRLNSYGMCAGVVSEELGERALAQKNLTPEWLDQPKEECYTLDLAKAGYFNREEILKLVPVFEALLVKKNDTSMGHSYFQPINPDIAHADVRLLQLRESGWGPDDGKRYRLKEIPVLFGVYQALILSQHHPFVHVPDGWIALLDLNGGPGHAEIASHWRVTWTAGCDCDLEGKHRADCPAAMDLRNPDSDKIIVRVFVRKGNKGKYTYLGIGHAAADKYKPGNLDVEIAPSLYHKPARALGVDTAWKATLSSFDLTKSLASGRPIRSLSDLERLFSEIRDVKAGRLIFERWGPNRIELLMQGSYFTATALESTTSFPHTYYFVNSKYVGDPNEQVEFAGKQTARRALHPRSRIEDLLTRLFQKDGDLPWMKHWEDTELPPPEVESAYKEGETMDYVKDMKEEYYDSVEKMRKRSEKSGGF